MNLKLLRKTMAIVLSALLIFAVLPIVAIGVSADDVSDAAALRTALTGSAAATLVLQSDITLSDVDGTMTLGNAAMSIDLNGHTLSYIHDDSVADVIPCMNLTNSKTTLTITNSSPDGLGGLASSVDYPLFAGSKKLAFGAGTMNNSYFYSTATYSTFAQDAVVNFNADCKLGSVTFSRATVSFNGKLDITGSATFNSGSSATAKTTANFYKPVTVGANFGTAYDTYSKVYKSVTNCSVNFANPYVDAENPGSTLTAGSINFGNDWCASANFATYNFASDVVSNGTFSFGKTNAEYFTTPVFGRNVTAGSIEFLSRSTIPGNLTTTNADGNCLLRNVIVNGNMNCAGDLNYSSNNASAVRYINGTTNVGGNLKASGYSTAEKGLVNFTGAVTVSGDIDATNAGFAANTTATGKIKLTGTTVTGTVSGEAELEFVSGSVSTDLTLAPTTLIQAGDFAGIVTAPAGSVVTVSGGTFTTAAFIGNATADITIKGGTFSTQPSTVAGAFIDGTEIDNGNGTYTVKHAYFQIGATQYYSLAEAVAAAADGDEIDLLEDYVITAKQIFSKNVTLDLNGHQILDKYFASLQSTSSGLDYTINAGYTLTMISTGGTKGAFKIHNGSGDAERPVFYAKGSLISYDVDFANGVANKSSIARAYSDSTIEIHNSTISCGYSPVIMNGALNNCTVNLYSVKCTSTNGSMLNLSATGTNNVFNVKNDSTDLSEYGSSFNGKSLYVSGSVTLAIENTKLYPASDAAGNSTITGGANVSFKKVILSGYSAIAVTVSGTDTFFSAEDSTIAGKKALVISGTTETVIKNSTINANANGSANFSITVSATTAKLTLSDITLTKNTSTIAWMSVVDGYTDPIIKSGYSVYSGETASAETLKTFEYLTTTNTNYSAYVLPEIGAPSRLYVETNNSSVLFQNDGTNITGSFDRMISNNTEITLRANASGNEFLFWTEEGKVRSEDLDYTFTMNGARNIDAVFAPGEGEGTMIIYRNTAADTPQILNYHVYFSKTEFTDFLLSTAYCYGKTFTMWDKDFYDVKERIGFESVIYLDACFDDIDANYNVSVIDGVVDKVYNADGTLTNGPKATYKNGDKVVISSSIDGFTFWSDSDGAVLSTNSTFTYVVCHTDASISANNTVFTGISDKLYYKLGDGNKLLIYHTFIVPEGCTLVDAGLIYTRTFADKLDLEFVDGVNIKATHLGAMTNSNTIFNTLSSDDDAYLCGFVIYKDSDGVTKTMYTDTLQYDI